MIKILWNEIKLDVDKETWRIAKVRMTDDEIRSDAQEDCSQMSVKFVVRFAEEGIAMVASAIREQLQGYTTSVSTDALNKDREQWTFTLKDSTNVNEDALAMLIHKFVVRYILFRWAVIWSPGDANLFKSEYVEALSDLVEEAFSIGMPKKVKPVPIEPIDSVEVEYIV